jgi:predicted Fe-Mo cluster-binding NifX family protein
MKIAVSCSEPSLDSDVNPMFGRCRYFLIIQLEDGEIRSFEAIENTAASQTGGAGLSAARMVAEKEVKAVITGNMGPRAFEVMSQFGIDVFSAGGPVKQSVTDFLGNRLKKLSGPGSSHMGLGRR